MGWRMRGRGKGWMEDGRKDEREGWEERMVREG